MFPGLEELLPIPSEIDPEAAPSPEAIRIVPDDPAAAWAVEITTPPVFFLTPESFEFSTIDPEFPTVDFPDSITASPPS